jgi:zinc protease
LLEELLRIVDTGITEAELNKARNIMIADFWRSISTINGKASALGNAEVLHGDYQRAFSLPDDLSAVSTEQIKAVAAAVFDRNKMTVGVLRAAEQGER